MHQLLSLFFFAVTFSFGWTVCYFVNISASHPEILPSELEMIDKVFAYENTVIDQESWLKILEYMNMRYHDNPANVIPWNYQESTYLWDFFPPVANCFQKERIGRLSDGGKWVCNMKRLKKLENCVVYSFGIDGEWTFEQEILSKTKCQIWALDPSSNNPFSGQPRVHFHKMGIMPENDSLNKLMREFGHEHVDLIKMDIEGGEFDVIQGWHSIDAPQILIEVHFLGNTTQLFHLFEKLDNLGMRPWNVETNHNPCSMGMKPFAMEFAFLRPSEFRLLDFIDGHSSLANK